MSVQGVEIVSNTIDYGAWAKYYAALGLRVLPLPAGQKSPPLLSDWGKKATTELSTIASWWATWPQANIGVAMGAECSLVDIETDIKPGADGEKSLEGLPLPDTWSFRSGGGGIHRLFRCDNPDISNRVNMLPGVDVRSNGGYSVFPPSLHPSGQYYSWLPGHSPQDMPQGPAPLPFELFSLIIGSEKKPPLEVPQEIVEGGRNDLLFRQACKLRRDGLSEVEILGAIRAMNEARCVPPLDEDEVETICRQAAKYEAGEFWEAPVPFESIETPPFPVEALPGPMGDFVKHLAESTQTPEEMAGLLSLGVLSTAFQKRYTVEITPDWREPLCLYCVAVAAPGERKSAVLTALTNPVYEYEGERRELEMAEVEQRRVERTLVEKALTAAQNQAASGKGNYEAKRQEALDFASRLLELKELVPYRLLVDDTTPEKLVDIMEPQGGCISIVSAEGGVFDIIQGRYDRVANFDVYLKGHAGDPISVDRIGRKANYIKSPRLTMILTVQPSVLGGLMDNTNLRGRGLCGRFLYAMCKSKVGYREITPATIPETVKEAYRQFVRNLLEGKGEGVIHLSPEADSIRQDYQRMIETRLGNEWEHMRDWGGKATGAMLRIAALFHASTVQGDPTAVPISPDTMSAAVSVAEFLGKHAEAAYQTMGSDETLANAKYLWKKIAGTGMEEISKRDLFNISKGKFRTVENMEPVLNTLISMGYIRIEEVQTGGRPTKKIKVNPA